MTDYSKICGKFAPAECLPLSRTQPLIELAEYAVILAILIAAPILLVKLRRRWLQRPEAVKQDATKVS